MGTYLDVIAQEWAARAKELAAWAFAHLVNRTDVWGSYVAQRRRTRPDGSPGMLFLTAPYKKARGKEFLNPAMLVRHFCGFDGNLVSLHSTSADKTSRWLAIDIDRHDTESATVEGNLSAALRWHDRLVAMGLDPLLLDSNGAGGYHLIVVFAEPVPTADVYALGVTLLADHEKLGLAKAPETYPRQVSLEEGHYGNCLRLLGKHHTREHWTRVWSGEPDTDQPWLEGAAAIERVLATRPARLDQLPRSAALSEELVRLKLDRKPPTRKVRPRVCVDLDGVLARYEGWKGLDFTGPPIDGAVAFTRTLAEFAEVVIFTTRCAVEPHRDELDAHGRPASDLAPRLVHDVRYWLDKHGFHYDDVYVGQGKPLAQAFIDDRAVRCTPQLDGALAYTLAAARARDLCRGELSGPPPGPPEAPDPRLDQVVRAWSELTEAQKKSIARVVKRAPARS